MSIGASELARLTIGKGVSNTAWRWLPFFLPTLAVAFDSSTAVLALLLGLAEAGGLAALVVGRWVDAGRERLVIIAALASVSVASAIALSGSLLAFAVAALLTNTAAAFVVVGGHAWIAARVPFDRRARFIGIYETSWAMALLLGVSIVALIINRFGWRGPFVVLGLAALCAIGLVTSISDGEVGAEAASPAGSAKVDAAQPVRLTGDAWLIIAIAAAIAMTGLSTVAVAGTWLDRSLGVSTGGIGLVAIAFGTAELIGSVSSSAMADRLGKRRTTRLALIAVVVGLAIMAVAGTSLAVGAGGLLVFFLGFEYAVVTAFSLVSEAMAEARGRVISVNSAAGTLARGSGVAAAGFLFERFGIVGPVVLSTVGAGVGLVLLGVLARRRPDLA